MDSATLFADLARRPAENATALPPLSAEVLNGHPGGHPNSPAWLLWHAGREIDVQLAHLRGADQLWESHGWRERLNLGEVGDGFGYGDTAEAARALVSDDQDTLVAYLSAVCDAAADYAHELSAQQWEEIIDTSYDPPVTRATRLISMIDDACQHVGQAAYVAGMEKMS